jgi:hypothetical protein
MSDITGVRSLVRLGERLNRLVAACRAAWSVCQTVDMSDHPQAIQMCELVRESAAAGDLDS